jgi:hypothetical protein
MKNNLLKYVLYLSALLFAFLSSQVISHAAIYKWVDEKGIFHMSDTPPDPATAQKYNIEKTGPEEPDTAQVAEAKETKSTRHEVVIYTTPT